MSNIIATPLCYIINNSLEQGIFPQSWKEAKCIPIFKQKGTRDKNSFPVTQIEENVMENAALHFSFYGRDIHEKLTHIEMNSEYTLYE